MTRLTQCLFLTLMLTFIGCGKGDVQEHAITAARTTTATPNESQASTEFNKEARNNSEKDAASIEPTLRERVRSSPAFDDYKAPGGDRNKTKWTKETARDAIIADDIPVFEGAMPNGGSKSNRAFVFEWESEAPKTKVMDFFRDELPKSGWTIETEESYGAFDAVKGDEKLSVWIGHEAGKPVSIMVRREY